MGEGSSWFDRSFPRVLLVNSLIPGENLPWPSLPFSSRLISHSFSCPPVECLMVVLTRPIRPFTLDCPRVPNKGCTVNYVTNQSTKVSSRVTTTTKTVMGTNGESVK